MSEFQFKPGDFVAIEAEVGYCFPTPRYRVLERITQECSGGIQRQYILRSFRLEENKQITADIRLQDFEVCAYPSAEDEQIKCNEMYRRSILMKKEQAEMRKGTGVSPHDLL